jgi:hypothetical protein
VLQLSWLLALSRPEDTSSLSIAARLASRAIKTRRHFAEWWWGEQQNQTSQEKAKFNGGAGQKKARVAAKAKEMAEAERE